MAYPLTKEQHRELYYFMKLNRELEDSMVRLFRQNQIVGGLYSSLGQEAISVGTAYALGPGDWIAPMIRNIGSLLVRGVPPRDVFTQHMARYTSPTHGKDGTSHFGDLKVKHIVSPISMLGDLIPVMTGVAMAGRYLGQKIVAMTWIGDGGSSTGAFHEGLNLAAVQRAPLVLVLENNQWAYSTPVSKQVPMRNLADRARAYGIQSRIVDGNDAIAVYETAKESVELARSGAGPVLIECKTMRMKGHAQHDPAEYVPRKMFEYWKARDPIARYEKYLNENNLWSKEEKQEVDNRIQRELAAEREFAENSPFPPPETAEQGAYCEGCHTIEAEWKRGKEEVMPPKSSIRAEYVVEDFGVFKGNGPAPVKKPTPAPASVTQEPEPAENSAVKSPEERATAEEIARVPFGRGPKDKAFREQNEQRMHAKGAGRRFPKKSHGHSQGEPFGKNPKRFQKNSQGKSFDRNNQRFDKNAPRKSFQQNPQGRPPFDKNSQDKRSGQ
jgi:TPP-dependent pyruvate/acetoin dehydrogenase alpha subunit